MGGGLSTFSRPLPWKQEISGSSPSSDLQTKGSLNSPFLPAALLFTWCSHYKLRSAQSLELRRLTGLSAVEVGRARGRKPNLIMSRAGLGGGNGLHTEQLPTPLCLLDVVDEEG